MTVTLAEQLAKAKVYDLEQPRFRGMPIHPAHQPGYFYALHRRHADNYRPQTSGPRSSASGMLSMMEHSGTHIDALCHQACGLELFGGVPVAEVESAAGFTQLGIETAPPLLTRGVLLDVAAAKGQNKLPAHYGITADDLQSCARSQGVAVTTGDVILVRTGFGQFWQDEPTYLEAAGIAKSGTTWAADQRVVAVGADNMAWDVISERDPETGSTLFAHLHLLTKKGIYILENLNLERLASDRCFEFAFVGIPLKFQGATGSPIRPLALV
jgi:kynurenine formamidase